MKNLDKLSVAPSASKLESVGTFFADNWLYVIVFLSVLAVFLLFFLYKKRKSNALAKKSIEVKEEPIPVSSFKKIWRGFLRELPWQLRRVLSIYHHFIVMGDVGAGKSSLIDSHTDWKGQALQFYPSYIEDPLLHIYLGAKILIQEIPSTLLNDTSKNARLALLKLWRPLYRHKSPTVVFVLNGMKLKNDDPEYLKKQAQVARGKINLLAQITGKPIGVRITLTHMSEVEGFSELSKFLRQKNIQLKLEFSSKEDIANIEYCLEYYEAYLEQALVTLSAAEYLKIITFMRAAPAILKDLSGFISILQSPDPLSHIPRIDEVCLTSTLEGDSLVSNPFATTLSSEELQKFNPLLRHQIAAAVLLVGGIIYLGNAFFYEKYLVEAKVEEVAIIEASPPAQYGQKIHQLFIDPLTSMQTHALMEFLPDFFPHINKEIDRRVIELIRETYLLPELERFYVEGKDQGISKDKKSDSLYDLQNIDIVDAQQKVLYFLGLLYATRSDDLGKLILKDPAVWAETLGLSQMLVEDYVKNNQSSWSVDMDIEKVTYRKGVNIATDLHYWMVYFTKIETLYQKEVISKADFYKLQKETDYLINVIKEIEQFDLAVTVAELLKRQSIHGVTVDLVEQENAQLRQKDVKNFLSLINMSRFDYPAVNDNLTLIGLWEHLKAMLHFMGEEDNDDRFYHFILAGREFKFNAKRWNAVKNRSRITSFLDDFIAHNSRHDGLLFFPVKKEFDDLVMNPFNDGSFLFSGHSIVDGRFTKEAFEQRVKPVLTELPKFFQQLPVSEKSKRQLNNFLFKEIEVYARRYAEAYRGYYMDFDINANSSGALSYVLTQLTLPSSQFMEFLLSVKENTGLELEASEYMRPMVLQLAEFEFFQRLMAEKKGAFPELEKYKSLLEQMQSVIGEESLADETKRQDKPLGDFASKLTPLGKISYSIYLDEPGSYLNLIKLWLKSVGISSRWQDVFLAPVYQAYALGRVEVEAELEKTWTALWRDDVKTLYSRFPFDKASAQNVSLAELKNATHPDGHFWQYFNTLLAPLCIKQDGHWYPRSGVQSELRLPGNMLPTLNSLDRISKDLWASNGEARPLEFMIRSAPLPISISDEYIPVLSYLHIGESAVVGFNQKPSWKMFKYFWHKISAASVGLEIATANKDERMQRSLTVSNANWSFFHLLQKAEEITYVTQFYIDDKADKDANTVREIKRTDNLLNQDPVWMLNWPIFFSGSDLDFDPEQVTSKNQLDQNVLNITFSIDKDPWTIFSLPPRE